MFWLVPDVDYQKWKSEPRSGLPDTQSESPILRRIYTVAAAENKYTSWHV